MSAGAVGPPGAAGGVVLGPLHRADAPRCAELEALLFGGDGPWSAGAFRAELDAGHHYLAARTGGALVGYAGLALMPAAPSACSLGRGARSEAEVHTIGVDPAHQGRGLGARLLGGLLEAADGIRAVVFLEVRTDNTAALALYRRAGFGVVGTRRRYYASGADAYTMRREAPDVSDVADPR